MNNRIDILIIDDEKSLRELIRSFLENLNYNVEEASNGSLALEKAAKKSYSIVLIDIMMPDINGLELASIFRVKYPDSFVVMMTGYGSIDLAKDSIQRGAFDFITKPFKMGELQKTIDRVVQVRNKKLLELPSPELKDLYNLTVNVNISDQSYQVYLESLAAVLRKTFRGDSCRIYLLDELKNEPLSKKATSSKEEMFPEELWERISRKSFESEKGYLDDVHSGMWINNDISAFSVVTVPIPGSDGNIGSFTVTRSSNPASFTVKDLKLMSLFAAQAGNQLLNYQMASSLRNEATKLETINILASDFSSSLSIKSVISSINIGLRSIIQFDLFGVFIEGDDTDPFSYILKRFDLPQTILQGQFRKILQKKGNVNTVNRFLECTNIETFYSLSSSDYTSTPKIEILDLGDLGTLKGMIVLSSWNPSLSVLEVPSRIHLLFRHAAAALSNAYLTESNVQNYIQTISALAAAVDAKDAYTHNHSRNVAAYATSIASHLDLSSRDVSLINNAALLHDIGKIGIPEAVLNKASSLTEEEFSLIKSHPEKGYTILKPITAFRSFIDAVKHHHEKYDGTGYPDNLSGTDIPFHARILTVADSFDAMVSDRIYRKSPGLEYAIGELYSKIGSQFDPHISRVFLSILESSSPEKLVCDYMSSQMSIHVE